MLSIKPGQKVYLLAAGDKIILMPLPENIDEELDKLSSDIEWNRKVRESLEQYLISKAVEKTDE
jgi:bifunctional DNA-binding transcriptional regulator/antitoxin component of YhaV-PrlF toxin-antitoxin module